jgi:hypothetical protein
MAKFILGLTLGLTLIIGPYVFSISRNVGGGEIRVSQAVMYDSVQTGKSWCLALCDPDSKTQKFQLVDISGPDLISASVNRTDGRFSTDVGLYKAVSLPTTRWGFGSEVSASLTTNIRDEDAIRLLRSKYAKPFLPRSVETLMKGYELRHNLLTPKKSDRKPVFFVPCGKNLLLKVPCIPTSMATLRA